MLRKKLFRELRQNAAQFVTIFLMVLISAFAFSGVHAYMDGMEDSADRYYRDYNLEDLWLVGENFTEDDLEAARAADNVQDAERVLAFQCNWARPEGNVTIETNFIETNRISRFYVFEGEDFDPDRDGLWLDYYLARNLGVKVGDEITLTNSGCSFACRVNGLIGTPDHVYAVKDSSVIFTDHHDFGFAYLSAKSFPEELAADMVIKSEEMQSLLGMTDMIGTGWALAKLTGMSAGDYLRSLESLQNAAESGEDAEEEMIDLDKIDLDAALDLAGPVKDGSADAEQKMAFLRALMPDLSRSDLIVFPQMIIDAEDTEALTETKKALETAVPSALAVTDRTVSPSWAAYQSEVEEGRTYSVIFSGMFLFIAILSVVTTMNRFVKKQRTVIGTLKALGFRQGKIICHYAGFGFITGLAGVVLGTVIGGFVLGGVFLDRQMQMFLVPEPRISFRPVVFAAGIAILAVITLVTYLSCRRILREPASQVLRAEQPRVKAPARAPGRLSARLPFSAKWNLRDIRRNKGRTLMAIAGIAGSCTLIVGALGMRDSLYNYLDWEFGGILHFAWQINLEEGYTEEEYAALTDACGDAASQTLAVEFEDGSGEKQTNIAVVNDAPGMLRLCRHDLSWFEPEDDGIYLTEKLAARSGVKPGDTVRWRVLGEDTWYESPVAGLNRDPQNQQLSMSRAYMESLGISWRPDTLYTDEDLSGVEALPGAGTIMSVQDLAGQMNSMLEIMNSLIGILIAVSAILGFVIIYNMGILSMSEKNYQFATLKVLGFTYGKLRSIFLQQNLWLTVISVILGLPLGYLMTDYIFKEAIGDNYDFFAMIEPRTYLIGVAGTVIIAVFSSLYLARKLKKIDMVSSLKANE